MISERLVRQALEAGVKDLTCPEPDLEQLVAAGRAMRRRRVAVVASLAAAAVLVLGLAGLSFAWAGRSGRALEPVPANPTTKASIGSAIASPMQRWVDALPAGMPPATPYWHDGSLYVNGAQIPAPYGRVDIKVAGDTVLVGGYQGATRDVGPSEWSLVRGGRLEPLPVPAGIFDAGLSVDGRIAYWVTHQPGTKRFFTWDTETNTALASRTVNGRQVELWGIDAAGNGYWQADATEPVPYYTRWDIRANTDTATDLTFGPWDPPESFDGFVPWLHSEDPYRSPDGTKVVVTGSVPSDSPSDCCGDQLRVRPVGPDDSFNPTDVSTLSLSQELHGSPFDLREGNGHWVWWESNESVLLAVDGDLRSYLVRCSAAGAACQRVLDLGPWTDTNHQEDSQFDPYWLGGGWAFGRAPASQ